MIALDKLKASDIETLILRDAREDQALGGRRSRPVRALSDSTIRQTYTVLRAALDGAVRDGLLARNPAAQVRRPGVERTEARHLRRRRDSGSAGRRAIALLPGVGVDRLNGVAQG